MFLCARAANDADVEIMLRLCRPGLRSDPAALDRERDRWRRLWRFGRIEGVVMEDLTRRDLPEVGMTTAVLIPPDLYEELLTRDASLIDGLAEAMEAHPGPWLDEREVGRANAGAGLVLLTLWFGYADEDAASSLTGLPPREEATLRSHTLTAFADRCRGDRICLYAVETAEPVVVRRFETYGMRTSRVREDTRILSMDLERALEIQNLWMLRFFAYVPPILGFTPQQKAVLRLARQGYTDQEIAAETGKTVDSVKKRWASIYARFGEIFPGLLPSAGAGARGQEKRRTLLTYLKDRPEELRPYFES